MVSALEESVDSLPQNQLNQEVETSENSETEELETTHDLCVGYKIELHWHLEDKCYPGSVSEYSENTGKHRINYDDGEIENLNMKNEIWCVLSKIKS